MARFRGVLTLQSMMQARQYQTETLEKAMDYAEENIRGSLLIVCPPGGGKTFIGAKLLQIFLEGEMRCLAFAPRRELVGQMYTHLVECGIAPELIGVTMAGDPRCNKDAPVQVASSDTLRLREKPPADFVLSDEAHHDASDGQRKLRAFYPDAFHCGLTGTPTRLDGRKLVGKGREYDHMIIAAQPSELIAGGWLAVPKIVTVPKEFLPDLSKVKKKGADFDLVDLEAKTNKKYLIGNSVEHWLRLADGRRTLVCPVGIKHSLAVVERFRKAGIEAEHVDGTTPNRQRIIERVEEGRLPIVSSCGVFSEGTNVPSWKCVMMLRPTTSEALSIQQAGRCMRPWEDVEPLILDHAGNVMRHGLPYDDRDWIYNDVKKGRGSGGPSNQERKQTIKVCHNCGLIVAIGLAVCKGCSAPLVMSESVPDEYEATLEPIVVSEVDKRVELERLQRFAKSRGMREGWAEKVYAAKFGVAA